MSATEEFAFLLALELGEEDPYALLARMPAKTFNAWRQFWRKAPFGAEADWMRNGLLAATTVNANPFRGKDSKAVTLADFMPPDPDKRVTTAMSESDRLVMGARLMGARILKMPRANRV